MPRGGRVLDVACGRGRHARFLAERGWHVHAIDRDAAALSALHGVERVTTEIVDLEVGTPWLGERCYEAVIVFRYLHRPLMPALVRAVAQGGVLVYETFTRGQARRGHPKNPAFLLDEGELPTLVAPLTVLRSREGDVDGQLLSSVVAVRR